MLCESRAAFLTYIKLSLPAVRYSNAGYGFFSVIMELDNMVVLVRPALDSYLYRCLLNTPPPLIPLKYIYIYIYIYVIYCIIYTSMKI